MLRDLFRDKRGRLSAYGLSCGYIELAEYGKVPVTCHIVSPPFETIGPVVTVTLWHEHGAFHVRAHNHADGERISWEVFPTLGKARRCYDRTRTMAKRLVASREGAEC